MPECPDQPRLVTHVNQTLEPIFAQFLALQRRQCHDLGQAIAAGDAQTAHRLAHSLKGATATYELPAAAAVARDIETAILLNDMALAASHLKTLTTYFDALDVVFIAAPALPPE
ncbi:MAG: Hpt domain-containing protein [Acidocella sp.]|nr:Hpt domain-containing protein [Acidocella sp.]